MKMEETSKIKVIESGCEVTVGKHSFRAIKLVVLSQEN